MRLPIDQLLRAAAEQHIPLSLFAADGQIHRQDVGGSDLPALTMVELGFATLREACAKIGLPDGEAIGFQVYSPDPATPTTVTEIVLGPRVSAAAAGQARQLLQAAGQTVVASADLPGRILDRLMRPYFNRALRAVEHGVAEPADLDRAVEMGLGYRQGPLKWLQGSSLVYHHSVTQRLHDDLGDPAYHPAATARIASRIAQQVGSPAGSDESDGGEQDGRR